MLLRLLETKIWYSTKRRNYTVSLERLPQLLERAPSAEDVSAFASSGAKKEVQTIIANTYRIRIDRSRAVIGRSGRHRPTGKSLSFTETIQNSTLRKKVRPDGELYNIYLTLLLQVVTFSGIFKIIWQGKNSIWRHFQGSRRAFLIKRWATPTLEGSTSFQ